MFPAKNLHSSGIARHQPQQILSQALPPKPPPPPIRGCISAVPPPMVVFHTCQTSLWHGRSRQSSKDNDSRRSFQASCLTTSLLPMSSARSKFAALRSSTAAQMMPRAAAKPCGFPTESHEDTIRINNAHENHKNIKRQGLIMPQIRVIDIIMQRFGNMMGTENFCGILWV